MMLEQVEGALDRVNGVLWGTDSSPLILTAGVLGVLLIPVGVYFTVRFGGFQFRYFGHMLRVVAHSFRPVHSDGISSFRAFATSISARVGAGNIAGVAIAITLGGPGAVFWMWVVALVGMATAVAESSLAQVFKRREMRDGEHVFRGGPAYYIQRGLKSRAGGVTFAVTLLIAFPFAMVALQSNVMANSLESGFGARPEITGAIAAVVIGAIIFGGIRRISGFSEVVAPAMAGLYLLVGLLMVITHLDEVPGVLLDIVRSAFGLQEATGGVVGYTIAQGLTQGVRRGLFSNEAGLGSAPNVAAAADVRHPVDQGLVQAFGVFVDTIVVCTTTAMIVLLGGVWQPGLHREDNGELLTQDSLENALGDWGSPFIAVSLFTFTFTTILALYYYGETQVWFLTHSRVAQLVLRLFVVAMVFVGSATASVTVWALAEVTLGLMAVVNLVALILLSRTAIRIVGDYRTQLRDRAEPVFDPARFPDLDIDPQAWPSRSEVPDAAD